MVKRHEYWRAQYGQNRYLQDLDEEELHQRGRDAFNVNLTTNSEAKISLLHPQKFGSEAMERWTHYLEECSLRGFDYEQRMMKMRVKEAIPDLLGTNGRRAAKAIHESQTANAGKLFKFGKSKYLLPLINEGLLRIQPASSFASPQHNVAVGDTETARNFKVSLSAKELSDWAAKSGLPGEFENSAQLEFSITSFTDYWLTCFGQSLQPRMAVDFDADAILVVRNAEEFRRRLRKAVRKVTDYKKMGHGPVKYFDPYSPNCDIRNIPLIKPFKFYYQHEFRYFWLPVEPTNQLKYIEVEMGNLNDLCELVTW